MHFLKLEFLDDVKLENSSFLLNPKKIHLINCALLRLQPFAEVIENR